MIGLVFNAVDAWRGAGASCDIYEGACVHTGSAIRSAIDMCVFIGLATLFAGVLPTLRSREEENEMDVPGRVPGGVLNHTQSKVPAVLSLEFASQNSPKL